MSTTVPSENYSSSNPPIPPKSTDLSTATTSRNRHAPIAPPEAIEEDDPRNRDEPEDEPEMEEVLILRYTADHVIRLFIPVTVCMAVVILMLNTVPYFTTKDGTYLPYTPFTSSDRNPDAAGAGTIIWQALANAAIFLGVIIVMTIVLVLLYIYRCYKIIFGWLILSVAMLVFIFTFLYLLQLLVALNVAFDAITLGLVIWNFGVVGMLVLFWRGPLLVQQGYHIIISSLMALTFIKFLPDWTTWVLLVFFAIYDIVAVLCPKGPLRILVETAKERNETIFPALIYSSGMVYMIDGDAGETLHVVPSQSTAPAAAPAAATVQMAPASTFSTSTASASNSDARNSAGQLRVQLPEEQPMLAPPTSPVNKPLAQNAARMLTGDADGAPQQSSRASSRQSSLNGSGRQQQQQQQPDVELSPVNIAAPAASAADSTPSRVPLLKTNAQLQNTGGRDSDAEAEDEGSVRAVLPKSSLRHRVSDRQRLTPSSGGEHSQSEHQPHRTGPADRSQSAQRSRAAGRAPDSADAADMQPVASSSSSSAADTPSHQQQSRPAGGRSIDAVAEQRADEGEEESQGVKMGLGDFIFYSVLVGKASVLDDWPTTLACFVAILVGLCFTLMLLVIYRRALPALPISIAFGTIFYFCTRFALGPFIDLLADYQLVP